MKRQCEIASIEGACKRVKIDQTDLEELVPVEIIPMILEALDPECLVRCNLVSKKWERAFSMISWEKVISHLDWTTDLELQSGTLSLKKLKPTLSNNW